MQRARVLIVLFAGVIAAGACDRGATARGDTTGAPAAPPPAGPLPDRTDYPAVRCDSLERTILAGPLTRAGLRDRFGAPDSTHAATEPNRHVPGAVDSLFTEFRPGLVGSFRTLAGARDLIAGAEVTGRGYIAHSGLDIGAPEARVVRILGEPSRRSGDALVYECGEVEQPVTFRLRDGIVTAVTIAYYVD
jgi:hypothetical protein